MIELWQAVVLGVVEGLTEFLPISSTGHLTIVEKLMGLDPGDTSVTAFTAVIQVGAIAAVVVYFWRDITRFIAGWARGLAHAEERRSFDSRFAWYIIAGSIPIGVVGLLGRHVVEGPLRSLWAVVGGLLAWSVVMVVAERQARQVRGEHDVTLRDAVFIGAIQVFALVPGVSRSGATISAGLFRDLDRVTATRVSFFLSIPALVAAGLFELKDAVHGDAGVAATAVGTLVSFVVAYASVAWLLRFVAHHSIDWFVPYRVLLALAVAGALASGALTAS